MLLLQLYTKISFLVKCLLDLCPGSDWDLRVITVCLYGKTFRMNLETYLRVTLLGTISRDRRTQQTSVPSHWGTSSKWQRGNITHLFIIIIFLTGVINSFDNCPKTYNPLQEDRDTDSVGDVCDNCPSVRNRRQVSGIELFMITSRRQWSEVRIVKPLSRCVWQIKGNTNV